MTATEYEGKKVVAEEPALSAIVGNGGEPIYFKQVLKLLLDDGSEVYGCIHCDYARPLLSSIRPHLKKHNPKPKKVDQDSAEDAYYRGVVTDFRHLTLDDILGLADRWLREGPEIEASNQAVLERLREDRDSWRDRALKAEKTLVRNQKLFKQLSGLDD